MQLRKTQIPGTRRVGVVVAVLSLLLLAGRQGLASPSSTVTIAEQAVSVAVTQRDPSVDPSASFEIGVDITVAIPTEYLETRVRILNPSGRLLYQKTEIRHGVEPGTETIAYARELADLRLPEGRYPIEVRVLASGSDPTHVEDRLLVVRDDRPPIEVAAVARFAHEPQRGPDDRYVIDPASTEDLRERVLAVAEIAREGRPLAVGIPPVMLEDWLRAASGYELAADGAVTVGADEPVPMAYAAALERLSRVSRRQSLELLDVPYAEPDLQGLVAMSALDDLVEHYRYGRSIYQASIATTPCACTAVAGDVFPPQALERAGEAGVELALLGEATVRSRDATPAPGSHPPMADRGPGVLLLDEKASRALSRGDVNSLVDRLFDVAVSGETSSIAMQAWFGPGHDADPRDFETALSTVADLPWAVLTRPSELAGSEGGVGQLEANEGASQASQAPLGYWGEVLEGRRLAMALSFAAGPRDADARRATRNAMMAESRLWAGADMSWSLADRGREFAAAAVGDAERVLSAITVSSEDIVLAGRSGKVPLSIANASEKNLTVTVTARGEYARVGPPNTVEVVLKPAENYVTLPVAMHSAPSDRLQVEIRAGETLVAATSVDVRVSYLDRLAISGSVVLVLVALLFYIRRRVMT